MAENRKTVNYPKGIKKAESKIDCWTNRKTNKKAENSNSNSYLQIHNQRDLRQPEHEKSIGKGLSNLEALITKIQRKDPQEAP